MLDVKRKAPKSERCKEENIESHEDVRQTEFALLRRNLFVGIRQVLRHVLAVLIVYNLYQRLSGPLLVSFCLSTVWRLFAEHAGGHRYLSHKSYRCTPWLLHLMALTITVRDIVIPFLYWSFHHNTHHFYCDTPEDLHSPIQSSFWHVQLNFTTLQQLKLKRFDFIATMPENCPVSFKKLKTGYDADLSYLTTRNLIMIFLGENIFWIGLGFILFNYSSYDIFPFELWAWVCFMPRLLVSHAANLTNSAAHMFGTRPYVGRDDGKGTYPLCKATNCWWAALLNFGEGWHNNHHAYALSARHGFLWWEVDVVYYGLYVLGMLGLIWDMQVVNDSIRLAPRDGTVNKHLTTKYDLLFVR